MIYNYRPECILGFSYDVNQAEMLAKQNEPSADLEIRLLFLFFFSFILISSKDHPHIFFFVLFL